MRAQRFQASAGAIFAGLAVICGAFGAHALKDTVTPEALEAFKTGANYQLLHGLALLLLAALSEKLGARAALSGWLFVVGIVLFSGSLYALALSGIKAFGMITPLGGLSLIAGWIIFAIGAFSMSPSKSESAL